MGVIQKKCVFPSCSQMGKPRGKNKTGRRIYRLACNRHRKQVRMEKLLTKAKNYMPKNIAFAENTITVTLADDTVQVFTTAPVVTDTEVTVTHADGSTETFEPKE